MNELGYISNQFWYVDLTPTLGEKVWMSFWGIVCNVLIRSYKGERWVFISFWYGLLSLKSGELALCRVYPWNSSTQTSLISALLRFASLLPNGCLMVTYHRKKVTHHLKHIQDYKHIVEWNHLPNLSCEPPDDICLTFTCLFWTTRKIRRGNFVVSCYKLCNLPIGGFRFLYFCSQQRMDIPSFSEIFGCTIFGAEIPKESMDLGRVVSRFKPSGRWRFFGFFQNMRVRQLGDHFLKDCLGDVYSCPPCPSIKIPWSL